MTDLADNPQSDARAEYAAELRRWRERRGLSKQALASQMAYDRSYVSHIEGGNLAPTEGFTSRAEEVLSAGGALWGRWEAVKLERADGEPDAGPAASDRDLQTVEFVAWLADHSSADFQATYQAVAVMADRLEAETASSRHTRSHQLGGVTRAELAGAMANYYEPRDGDQALYRATVGDAAMTLSIMTEPTWLGTAVQLRTQEERVSFQHTKPGPLVEFDEGARNAAMAKLAEVEMSGTVMVNNPIYRLLSIDIGPQSLDAVVTASEFASYALTCDLMEAELIDAVSNQGLDGATPGRLPLRDRYLPTSASANDFESRESAGGPACLFAVARPARGGRPADYALLIQERSARVLNAAGKLAVIPKAFHQPVAEPAEEADLGATLLREFEEELLGRSDLEQLAGEAKRQVDVLHQQHRSAPLAWLLDRDDGALRTECTGFGINLVTGTYEFACLMVIEDEGWWEEWGHMVEANWEAMRVHRFSSRDTDGLAALSHDPRWSNEGLFAFLEGLRRLAEFDDGDRVAAPSVNLEEPR